MDETPSPDQAAPGTMVANQQVAPGGMMMPQSVPGGQMQNPLYGYGYQTNGGNIGPPMHYAQ